MTAKTLVIAEKPSVAGDIARALGGMQREKDFFESEHYVVSSAVGHLLELSAPEKFEAKRGKWSLNNLPVLPDYFDLNPIKASEGRLRILKSLYKREDIKSVINACDAGREGELIFYNLMRHLNGKGKKQAAKPVQRLWLSSMTPTAIRTGFNHLRNDADMRPLQHAAVCRSEADWLVGINSTRAMTALHSTGGGFTLTTVGRVQTPTLAIIVERDQQIEAFVPRDYWEVRAAFAAATGEYEGRWVYANTKEAVANGGDEKKLERIFVADSADEIIAACQGQSGVATEKKKPASESPPMLFDLTSLQREANTRFSLPARATLAAAQALYERHKAITYPRTDSKALPEDYAETVKRTLQNMAADEEIGDFACKILAEQWVKTGNKRIFNNAKVSDHFAIVPTGVIPKNLRDVEYKIYRAITRRFLAAFYPPARFEVTERRTVVKEHLFETKGRILLDAGWREPAGQMPQDAVVTPIVDGETVNVADITKEQKRTAPPPRYNEATLLSAMEGAGKLVDDEELREAMRERGIGTPATRAAIIEGLVKERYLLRDGRDLLSTPKAHSLLRLLRALKVEDLTRPAMTGDWEHKLRRMERADFDNDKFMAEIRTLTMRIVSAAQACGEVESVPGDYAVLNSPCPSCGGEVRETHRRFSCAQCDFFIWKAMSGRELSVGEADILLAEKKTAELEGFRSRLGREFAASVILQQDDNNRWRATFDFDNNNDQELTDLTEKEAMGVCPKCGATVRDAGSAYICERKAGEQCDFSFPRRILQREIPPAEMTKLLTDGKTGVLEGFISKKSRRPFKAHLLLDIKDKSGKLSFEFPPRAGNKKRQTAAKKKAK